MGAKTSTSKTTRPGYIQDMINQLSGNIKTADLGNWIDQNYAGLNNEQQGALGQLMASPELNNYAQELMGAGQQGLDTLDSAHAGLQDLYNKGNITANDVNGLAGQLYDRQAVEDAIDASNKQTEQQLATSTLPEVAQQTMQDAGYGSMQRLAKDRARTAALTEMQNAGANISQQAYENAQNQATSILSGNRQNQLSALSGLNQLGGQQAALANQGAEAQQQAFKNQLAAGDQEQQNAQGALDTQYSNAIGSNNYNYQLINNQIGAASVLNGALGQKQTTTTSGGGSGIAGGAMAGAAAGSAFGPWGALAGAVIGGVAGAASS